MPIWFVFGGLLHACLLLAAVRFSFSRNVWVAIVCQLGLGLYLITLWSYQNDAGNYGRLLAFFLFGPFLGLPLLFHAADSAPAFGYTALGIGAVAGLLVGLWVGRSGRARLAPLLGQLTFALVSWLAAEALVEVAIRTRAAQQFGSDYCIVSRSTVPQMIKYGTADRWVMGTHVTLLEGGETYYWSFERASFVLQENANFIEADPVAASCR